MVVVTEPVTLADIDEALANVSATMRISTDPQQLLETLDALLDARLGVQ